MASRLVPNLVLRFLNLFIESVRPPLEEHEVEDRLIENLLGKSLEFTVAGGRNATIRFHSLGSGKDQPSTVVTLQVLGVDFEQEANRLALDFRYIFYKAIGHSLLFPYGSKFLVTSPKVQKLGPENILIEFAVYGNTIHQVNRSLELFAEVIRRHQNELHQTAIEKQTSVGSWSEDTEIELNESISVPSDMTDPIEIISSTAADEGYIEEYIKYISNHADVRRIIDNRNTHARSEFD